MWEVFVVIGVLIFMILFLGWMIYDEREHSARIEDELLNRLMAKDYPMYVQGEVAKEQSRQPLTPEQIYEMQQERGIPI